jgi:hypothetical protein
MAPIGTGSILAEERGITGKVAMKMAKLNRIAPAFVFVVHASASFSLCASRQRANRSDRETLREARSDRALPNNRVSGTGDVGLGSGNRVSQGGGIPRPSLRLEPGISDDGEVRVEDSLCDGETSQEVACAVAKEN